MTTKSEIAEIVIALLAQLASDWDYDGAITPQTYLFSDLGFQSLDAVVLGNSLQERLGRPIPYADLHADFNVTRAAHCNGDAKSSAGRWSRISPAHRQGLLFGLLMPTAQHSASLGVHLQVQAGSRSVCAGR